MKVSELVRLRGRKNKDYGIVIKVGKTYFDVLMLAGTWKGEVWSQEDASAWKVISESR